MKITLIAIGVAIIILIVYIYVIDYAKEKKIYNDELKNFKQMIINDSIICEEGYWSNQSLPKDIYLCGVNQTEACIFIIEEFCYNPSITKKTETINGDKVQIGMGESVSVQTKKERWYGTIIGDGENEDVYILKQNIKLPLKVNNESWKIYHRSMIGFLTLLILIVIFIEILIKLDKREMKGGNELELWEH